MNSDDAERALREHRSRASWVHSAEAFLERNRGPLQMASQADPYFCLFNADVPYAVWAPQLRARLERERLLVRELDARLRAPTSTKQR